MNLNNCKMKKKNSVSDTMFYIIGRAKRAPHWAVQSRFRVIYMSVCLSCPKMRRRNYVCACSKSVLGS